MAAPRIWQCSLSPRCSALPCSGTTLWISMRSMPRWTKPIRDMNPPKAAIDIACYDILGKKSRSSCLHPSLGGKARDFCISSWPIGATDPRKRRKRRRFGRRSAGYTTAGVKAGSTGNVEARHSKDRRRARSRRQGICLYDGCQSGMEHRHGDQIRQSDRKI